MSTNEIVIVVRFPKFRDEPSLLSHFDVHQAIINDLSPALLQRVRNPGLDCVIKHQGNDRVEIIFSKTDSE